MSLGHPVRLGARLSRVRGVPEVAQAEGTSEVAAQQEVVVEDETRTTMTTMTNVIEMRRR